MAYRSLVQAAGISCQRTGVHQSSACLVVLLMLFAGWGARPLSAANDQPSPLTEAAQVRGLSAVDASRGYPVSLTGVVTLYAPSRGLFYVQDATGGIFIAPPADGRDWREGQKVEIKGVVAQGSHLPYVNQARLRDLGDGTVPVARPVTFAQLAADTEDGNWVEIRGVIRTVARHQDRLVLEIAAEGKRLRAICSDWPANQDELAALVDAEVRLQGVSGMVFRDASSGVFIELHVPRYAHLRVEVKAPEKPSLEAPRSVVSLGAVATPPALIHRVKVRGNLNIMPDGVWRISDPTGAAVVRPLEKFVVQSNSLAEVLGFPSGQATGPTLEDASVRFLALNWPENATSLTNATRENLPVLTKANAIRQLPPHEAQRGYAVQIRGVVTYLDPDWKLCFIQDDTGGISVFDDPFRLTNTVGQLVTVDGFSGAGTFAPIIRHPNVQVLGQNSVPAPKPTTLEQLLSGSEVGLRVALAGVVQYLVVEDAHLTVHVITSGGLLKALVRNIETNQIPAPLVDAEVQIAGVCGPLFNRQRQLTGVQLYVCDLSDIRVTKPAPADPFALPVQTINTLGQFQPQTFLRHRIHVRGTVTYRDPRWYTLFVQDQRYSLYIRTLQEPRLAIGDQIDVAGFVIPEAFGPVMSEAVFRRIGPGQPPPPESLSIAQAVSGDYDGHLVTLEARLVDRVAGTTGHGIVMQEAEWTFAAFLEGTQDAQPLATLREGSRLRLTGISCQQYNERQVGTRLYLHLRSAADVVVLKQPPWWTPRHWGVLLAALLAVLVATLAWIDLLQRSVRKQTAVIRSRLEHEAALEAQYRELFESVSDLIQSLNPDGSFRFVNPAWVKALGYSAAEAAQLSISAILHPDDVSHCLRLVDRVKAGEQLNDVQARFLGKDGRVIEVEGSCSAGSKDGEPSAILGIFRDVTARNRAEKALRENQLRYQAILDNIPDPAFLKDASGHYLAANPAWCRLMGVTAPRAMVGKTIFDFVPAEVAEKLHTEERSVVLSGQLLFKDEYLQDAQQRRRWFQTTLVPILNDRNQVTGIAGIARDISGRKRAETALEHSQAQLAAIYDGTPIMMCLVNERLEVERTNQSLRQFIDAKIPEDGAQRPGNLLGCLNAQANPRGCGFSPQCATCPLRLSVAQTFDTGQPCQQVEVNLAVERQGRRQEYWVSVSTAMVRMADGSRVLICLADITARKQLEAQFRQAQKMEAVGQLAGSVAHDFNNILAATILHLQLLKDRPDLDPEMAAGLRELENYAQRAISLTRQLLFFSRRQAMESKCLDLNEVLAGLMKMLGRLLGEDIAVEISKPTEALWANADAGMLEQLVMNLCVNARDAMPKGGCLKLSLERVDLKPEDIRRQNEARVGQFVRLSVTDTGCGMNETTLARIFEPFFTTKEAGKGTGLGLATVYGIAKQHQGWVEVASAVGRGTTFRVYLPAIEKPQTPKSSEKKATITGGTETILLVEDEASLRQVAKIALTRYGYQVLEAQNGVEALQLWRDHQKNIALLLTDMVMPAGMTGLELAERLLQLKPTLKVIVSSGYSMDMIQRGAPNHTRVKFVSKPYTAATLASVVRVCLDERVD